MIAMSLARGILLAGLLAPVAIALACIVREDRRIVRAAREKRGKVDYSQPDRYNKKGKR